MKQEQKELLLKDLCARLPYGVKLECKWKTPAPNGTYGMIYTMDSFLLDQIYNVDDVDVPFDEFKPYLFPLTYEVLSTIGNEKWCIAINTNGNIAATAEGYDWLNAHHYDYRNLIKKGLAIDATGLNIY